MAYTTQLAAVALATGLMSIAAASQAATPGCSYVTTAALAAAPYVMQDSINVVDRRETGVQAVRHSSGQMIMSFEGRYMARTIGIRAANYAAMAARVATAPAAIVTTGALGFVLLHCLNDD